MMNKQGQINIVLQDVNRPKKTDEEKADIFTFIDSYFKHYTGLEYVIGNVKEIYAAKVIHTERERVGLSSKKQVLHMIFTGNPGTGKTTVARTLAKVLFDLNILSKGHFIEAERADLVGEYIGQTAQKTGNLIQKSLGGILFIDEAYSLARGGNKDFGREAIDTLVKQMEDYADQFLLILAGYPFEMKKFLSMNPGLSSRFPFIIQFPDYSSEELINISEQMTLERQYELTPQAKWKISQHIRDTLDNRPPHFANARYVRNIIEKSIRMQSLRLVQSGKFSYHDLLYIRAEDIHFPE